jgi:hypothetical protein
LRDVVRDRWPGKRVFTYWDYRAGMFHRDLLRLRGTEDITIEVRIDAGWDPDHVRRVLVRGRWTLFADGRCRTAFPRPITATTRSASR